MADLDTDLRLIVPDKLLGGQFISLTDPSDEILEVDRRIKNQRFTHRLESPARSD